jgi:hypothetical protein
MADGKAIRTHDQPQRGEIKWRMAKPSVTVGERITSPNGARFDHNFHPENRHPFP